MVKNTQNKKNRKAIVPKPTKRQSIDELYKPEFIQSLKQKGLYESFIKEMELDIQRKEQQWKAKEQKLMKSAKKQNYYLSITFTYYILFYNANPPFRAPSQQTTIHKTVNTKNVSDSDVKSFVKDDLRGRESEYTEYILVSVDDYKFIKHEDVAKNANYDPKNEYMFSASPLNFSWIPDIKFDSNNRCVYNAFEYLVDQNYPKGLTNRFKLLEYFQERENIEANIKNREPRYLTFDSGVKPIWIQSICEKYDITHYCLDIENNMILKHIGKSKNYKPLCYITHDNHMYLITDKTFVQCLSQSRANNDDCKVIVKMLQENAKDDEQEIKVPIYADIPVQQLNNYENCYIIYQTNDLTTHLEELYQLTGQIQRHQSRNKKIVKIIYEKNKITLAVDPNFALKHYINTKTEELLTYKHVQEVCKLKDMPFKNQPITSIIHEIGFNNKKHERIQCTKEQKTEILTKQNNKCNVCQKEFQKLRYQFDHIIPLSANGTNELTNIQALCIECHFAKSKNEQDNGEYYSLPAYASTFNKRCREVILSSNFNSYAFIERSFAPAKKHTNFYIDINKCRRNILLHLKEKGLKFPVYTVMDDIKPFEKNDKIDVGFYFIESQQYLPLRHNGWYYYGVVSYCLENKLIQKENIKFKFNSSLSLDGDYFNDAVHEMIQLPYNLGKASVNFFVGLMRKGVSEINKIHYTKSFRQASSRFLQTSDKEMFITTTKFNNEEVFKVITSEKLESDYFTNVLYKLVVDMETVELHQLKSLVENNNGHVTQVNTDCVECWFNNDEPIDLNKYFWDKAGTIQKYKFETKDEPPERERMKNFTYENTYHFDTHEWNTIDDPMHDNFNELVNEILGRNQSFNINGIAGAGKTYLLKLLMSSLEEKKVPYKVLAPTNKACRNLSKDASTIHKFLGCSFKNTEALYKQLDNIEYLIIDEISMVREVFYSIFLTIMRIKPTLKFIIAGDIKRQLTPVNDRADFDYENSRALYEICQGNRLELTKCRRSDKKLFDVSLNVNTVDINEFKHEENPLSICFTNAKRIERNFYWMKYISLKRKQKYLTIKKLAYDPNSQEMRVFKSLPIIARVNNKAYDIANSETFVVKEVRDEEIVITDDEGEKIIKLEDFSKLFYPGYCMTTHKAQGTTIDKPFTIYEWNRFDTRLRYTAITRASKFENISIIA